MATKPGQPLSAREVEIVASLDTTFQPYPLRHRERVLQRGIPFTFTDGRRSPAEQDALVKERPRVAVRFSKHTLGFAYDFDGPRTDEEWRVAASEAQALGLESGINYRPTPERWHVEAPTARAELATFQALKLAAIGVTIGIVGLIAVKAMKKP